MPTRCTAATARGTPCRAWAVQGTTPPRCAAHGGAAKGGAPAGNQNARKHGVYDAIPMARGPATLTQRVDDLDHRIAELSDYIDEHKLDLDVDEYVRLLELYSRMIGRLGRVRRLAQQLEGGDESELDVAIREALDELSAEWGVEL